MTMYVNINGTWTQISRPKTKKNNAWVQINAGYVKVDGVWRRFFPDNAVADILLVGGGGAGGSTGQDEGGGGGGGGGVVLTQSVTLNAGNTYTIVVGAGGVTYNNSTKAPNSQLGGNTSISGSDISTLIAYGGGGGANYAGPPTLDGYGNSVSHLYPSGQDGASGGGGSGPGQYYPGGKAIYGNQGNNGAGGPHEAPGGGGGGYGGAPDPDHYNYGGPGGVIASRLDTQTWSVGGGGGGGSSKYSGSDGGNGGTGGGGNGDGDSVAGGTTYAPQGGGGGGGGCFIGKALVTLASGKQVPISKVKVGDFVYNYNRTSINQVKFLEISVDTDFESLYSPSANYKPFATINHPVYIAGQLSSTIPEQVQNWYPWLNATGKIQNAQLSLASGQQVYNLWVDGDGTYIINNYGTTSIIGDGGILRLLVEQELLTATRASQLLYKFTGMGKSGVYGAYLFNQAFGRLNIKLVNKTMAWIYGDESHQQCQKIVNTMFKLIGFVACKFKGK